MFRSLIFFSLILITNSKSLLPWNITTTTTQTTAIKTSAARNTSTSTTTIVRPEEDTTTSPVFTTTTKNDESYEFHSNFSRNNDSVFVSLHLNASDTLVSINNTFIDTKDNNYSSEIVFNENSHFNKITQTKIIINFNEPFTREFATQLGDRFIDFADLLLTIRSMANLNKTEKNVS
jgi:hypothetical protein